MRLPSSLFFILLVFINGFISTANAAADLSLNVSADVGSFSILVTNDGSENAHGVTVKLSNACLNYSFYSYSRNGRRVNCTASTVDIGSVISGRTTKVYLPFTYKVNQAQSIVAEIFSSSRYDIDSTPNNNQAAEDDQVTVSVPARPVATTHNGLAISITPTGSSTRIHWTYHPIQVSLENTNSAEISNIEFRMDAHAQQLTLQSIEGDGEIIYATDDEGNVLH